MSEKQYPLHHDHGTVTISRDVFESMTAELERLRPMETGLELAEANRDAYKKRVEELAGKYKELAKDHDKAIQACCNADKRIARLQHALWIARATALKRLDVDGYIRKHMNSIFWQDGVRTFNEACCSMRAIILVQIRKCRAKAKEFE
jgi:hypothetical protein